MTGGGVPASNKTSLYSRQGWERDLGDLNTARYRHACSKYTDEKTGAEVRIIFIPILCHLSEQVLLVTGGWDGISPLSSTETSHDLGNTWFNLQSAALPNERYGLRAGNINNRIFIFGENLSTRNIHSMLRYSQEVRDPTKCTTRY